MDVARGKAFAKKRNKYRAFSWVARCDANFYAAAALGKTLFRRQCRRVAGAAGRYVGQGDGGGGWWVRTVVGVRSHPPRGTVAACTRVTTYQICLRSTRVGIGILRWVIHIYRYAARGLCARIAHSGNVIYLRCFPVRDLYPNQFQIKEKTTYRQ